MAQRTSVRAIPVLKSSRVSMAVGETGSQKLGHPVPESYLVSDENKGVPHPAQR